MKINIDHEKGPIYLQLVDQLKKLISDGELTDGEKLPSERSLSTELEISRGTITKVYDQLEKDKLIVRIKGKGCFVTRENTFLSLDRKEKAVKLIKDMVRGMSDMGFSLSEIRIFTEIVIMEQEKKYRTIQIGIIDCNLEALQAIRSQIGSIKDVKIQLFQLEDIVHNHVQSSIMSMDLLITTYKHYEKIVLSIEDSEEKLIRVAMSPSKKTLIEIGRIRKGASLGILYESIKFLEIMQNALEVGEISLQGDESMSINEAKETLVEFLKKKEIVILPPLNYFESSFRQWLMNHIQSKNYIEFEYLIERGNLLLLEERIRHLMIMK